MVYRDRKRFWLMVVTLSFLLGLPVSYASASETLDDRVVAEALHAAGISDPAETERLTQAIRRAADGIIQRMHHGPPTKHRARRLHKLLHRELFRDYVATADGLHEPATTGRYNCLSASLFYGLVAQLLGYDVKLLEYPGHVLLQMEIDGRQIVIEATLKSGFDLHQHAYFDPQRPDPKAGANTGTYLIAPAQRKSGEERPFAVFDLETAVSFTWLNRAWRALAQGDELDAAESTRSARSRLPDLERVVGVRRLLSRAFSARFERGDFDSAYRIAAIDVELFPAWTTSRDRLFAVALKRIEDLCDSDFPEAAREVLSEVRQLSGDGRDLGRLERRVYPLIAASAVRGADWRLALVAAEIYADSEPDPVESKRLLDWVQARAAADPN